MKDTSRVEGRGITTAIRIAALVGIAAAAAAVIIVDRPGAALVAVAAGVVAVGLFSVVALWLGGAFAPAPDVEPLSEMVDAIEEAVAFSDDHGIVRMVNRAASSLFGIDAGSFVGGSYLEFLRTLARRFADPEGFMEEFQKTVDDPRIELAVELEQIIPERRRLRLRSSPARDPFGRGRGRVDVYTDITELVQRAAEVEELLESARKTAESYQRALLPAAPPDLPRVSVVAHYLSSSTRAVCGDFFDFVPLVDGRMGLVIGDVSGHGPRAASDAALTRFTLRSFASQIAEPTELIRCLNQHVARNVGSERMVRLVFCALDPERAILEYSTAGHVPPVVYRARSGEVEWLSEGGIPLGVDEDSEYKVGRLELEPADTLVLYTDGITESTRRGRPFGQGKFSDLIAQYGMGTAGELVQALRRAVGAWVPDGELRDDIAMLVCEVVPDEVVGEPTRELVVPNEAVRIGDIRSFVAGFLADVRTPVEASQDIVAATGEAAGNAYRHGRPEDRYSEIRVRCALHGPVVSIWITDEGPGFRVEDETIEPPDRFAAGGRGLFLMQNLMDDVDVDASEDGTTVRMSRRVFGDDRRGAILDPTVKK